MNGRVDSYGRALISVSVRSIRATIAHDFQAWIDTGFNGDLVLPAKLIDEMALPPSGTVKAILADGSEITLQRYLCLINWFGEERDLEVVANEGDHPLLGVGLLLGHELHISYRTGEIEIE